MTHWNWYFNGCKFHAFLRRLGSLRLRSCLFCEGRISVLKRWFKTPIQNAVHGSTVYASLEKKTISWACTAHCSRLLFELKWTGKAFIWRHLNVVIYVILRSCFHQNQRFALTTIVNAHFWAAFMLILRGQNQRFETLIQNADPKRRSREYCLCFPREEDDFVSMHCALFEAIVRAEVNRKGVYMTSFKRGYICDFAFMLPPESAFCSNHDRKRTFLGVLNQRFETTFIRK